MSIANIDLEKNRLYIKLDNVKENELADEVYDVVKKVRELKPGFTCINQIKIKRPLTEKEDRFIRLIQEFLVLKEVTKVIRVSDETVQSEFEDRSIQAGGYSAQRADSMEEAEKILDQD